MWEKLPESKIHQESLHRLYPVYTSPEPDSEFVQSEAFLNTTKLSVSGSAYSTVTLPLRKTQLKNGTTSFLSFFGPVEWKSKKNLCIYSLHKLFELSSDFCIFYGNLFNGSRTFERLNAAASISSDRRAAFECEREAFTPTPASDTWTDQVRFGVRKILGVN